MTRSHGRVSPAADRGFELSEERGRAAGGALERAAEVEHVVEAQLVRDLLDRLGGVEHLPLGLPHDALAEEFCQRQSQMRLDELRERLRRDVEQPRVLARPAKLAVV